jgi:hypothetical protein
MTGTTAAAAGKAGSAGKTTRATKASEPSEEIWIRAQVLNGNVTPIQVAEAYDIPVEVLLNNNPHLQGKRNARIIKGTEVILYPKGERPRRRPDSVATAVPPQEAQEAQEAGRQGAGIATSKGAASKKPAPTTPWSGHALIRAAVAAAEDGKTPVDVETLPPCPEDALSHHAVTDEQGRQGGRQGEGRDTNTIARNSASGESGKVAADSALNDTGGSRSDAASSSTTIGTASGTTTSSGATGGGSTSIMSTWLESLNLGTLFPLFEAKQYTDLAMVKAAGVYIRVFAVTVLLLVYGAYSLFVAYPLPQSVVL